MFLSIFNACEAAFWLVLSVFVVFRCRKGASLLRRWSRITSAWLALFAASDVIEVFTGAWWRPPALLVLKGVCLCGLLVSATKLLQHRRDAAGNAQPGGGL